MLKKILFFSLIPSILFAQAPMQMAQQNEDPFAFLPAIVATVGEEKITKEKILETVSQITSRFTQQGMSLKQIPPQYLTQFVQQALDQEVEQIVLLDIAIKDGFQPSEELAEQTKALFENRIRQQRESINNLPDEEKEKLIQQIQQARGVSLDDVMNEQIKSMQDYVESQAKSPEYQKMMAIQLWVNKNIIEKTSVADQECREYYDSNPDRFQTEESVTASHILITPEGADPRAGVEATEDAKKLALDKILSVQNELKEGADFAEMAKKHSTGPSGPKGGNLGNFGRGQMVPPFEKAAFELNPGEISEVVETQFGYHLIQVSEKQDANSIAYATVKEQIKAQLESQKIDDGVKKVVAKAKETLEIVKNF